MSNLVFAGIVFRQIYGKKLNPHQSRENRARQTRTIARVLVSVSIAATVFIALNVALAAFDLRDFQAAAHSIYFQLLAVISFQTYLLQHSDFDVYKEHLLIT